MENNERVLFTGEGDKWSSKPVKVHKGQEWAVENIRRAMELKKQATEFTKAAERCKKDGNAMAEAAMAVFGTLKIKDPDIGSLAIREGGGDVSYNTEKLIESLLKQGVTMDVIKQARKASKVVSKTYTTVAFYAKRSGKKNEEGGK